MDAIANLSAASYLTQTSNADGGSRQVAGAQSGSASSQQATSASEQAVEQAVAESAVNSIEQGSASSVELVTPTGEVSSDTQLGGLINTTA